MDILYWFNSNLRNRIYDNTIFTPLFEVKWQEFENTPANSDDDIEVDFSYWQEPARLVGRGTYRFGVLHWFDEKMPNRLVMN